MPIRILATADLHIGRTSTQSIDLGEWGSTRHAWLRMVDYAIREGIDLILIAGDLVEHDNRYYEASAALKKGFDKLSEAGIYVVMTAGNHDHDVLPQLIGRSEQDHMILLGREGHWSDCVLEINGMKVQCIGWSFPRRFHEEDPAQSLPQGLVRSDMPTLGLVHGDLKQYAPDSPYAPISQETLEAQPVDLWVMGHIHKPLRIREAAPCMFYPGTPQALNPKETGLHGFELLELGRHGITPTKTVPFSSIRYEDIDIDITETEHFSHIREQITDAMDALFDERINAYDDLKEVVADVHLTGYQPDLEALNRYLAKQNFSEVSREVEGRPVMIRRVYNLCKFRVNRLDLLASEPGPAGLLAQTILDLEAGRSSPLLNELRESLAATMEDARQSNTYKALFEGFADDGHANEGFANDRQGDDRQGATTLNKESQIKEWLIEECHRTLSEMMQTKHQDRS